jgi:intergrase/recombinase
VKHVKDIMNYSENFADCLLNEDFSVFSGFSAAKRRHVLAALANLSKFLGKYEDFNRIKKAYGLKWESARAEDLLISRMARVEVDGSVLEWIESVKERLARFNVFIDFILVSGLRLGEAVNSYNLIIDLARKNRLSEYYNSEKEILEHFRYRKIFIRNNKKAFMSVVPRKLVQNIVERERLTCSQIDNALKHEGLKSRFSDVREYFATSMTKWLSQPEIDFLQGRVSASVFMRNYFNPGLIGDLKERVFEGLEQLSILGENSHE